MHESNSLRRQTIPHQAFHGSFIISLYVGRDKSCNSEKGDRTPFSAPRASVLICIELNISHLCYDSPHAPHGIAKCRFLFMLLNLIENEWILLLCQCKMLSAWLFTYIIMYVFNWVIQNTLLLKCNFLFAFHVKKKTIILTIYINNCSNIWKSLMITRIYLSKII